MNLPPAIERAAARFNALTLRERVLVASAALLALVLCWVLGVFDPMSAKERALTDEIASIEEALNGGTDGATSAVSAALERETQLKAEIEQLNAKLTSTSAGLIPPERMVQVIRDVLSHQQGVVLVSLHNKPVTPLVPQGAQPQTAGTDESVDEEGAAAAPTVEAGPYVHPVELVIEGRYLDILAYMQALEKLPWRLQWQLLELNTKSYPMNRVRVEISTLSMDKEWIGV